MVLRLAEWCRKVIWLAYPTDADLWREHLAPAQAEFSALLEALAPERMQLLFSSEYHADQYLKTHKLGQNVDVKIMPYGDIWLRDTLPLFVKDEQGDACAVIPKFNGWGNKYLLPHDDDLADRVTDVLGIKKIYSKLCFEGGAVESNGEGLFLTTEECLLNKNRNPGVSKARVEAEFAEKLGAKKVIWLKKGLLNDHTDGHVDTIARFIAPNKIAIMVPADELDPNTEVLLDIKDQLTHECDLAGRAFELVCLPSPGVVRSSAGDIMPASYVNFIIGQHVVVLPAYGTPQDGVARAILSEHFTQKVVSLSAKAILTGGGAFHCISQDYFL